MRHRPTAETARCKRPSCTAAASPQQGSAHLRRHLGKGQRRHRAARLDEPQRVGGLVQQHGARDAGDAGAQHGRARALGGCRAKTRERGLIRGLVCQAAAVVLDSWLAADGANQAAGACYPPTPQWCTATQQRGRSQSCGAVGTMMRLLLGATWLSPPPIMDARSDQPATKTARLPVFSTTCGSSGFDGMGLVTLVVLHAAGCDKLSQRHNSRGAGGVPGGARTSAAICTSFLGSGAGMDPNPR